MTYLGLGFCGPRMRRSCRTSGTRPRAVGDGAQRHCRGGRLPLGTFRYCRKTSTSTPFSTPWHGSVRAVSANLRNCEAVTCGVGQSDVHISLCVCLSVSLSLCVCACLCVCVWVPACASVDGEHTSRSEYCRVHGPYREILKQNIATMSPQSEGRLWKSESAHLSGLL